MNADNISAMTATTRYNGMLNSVMDRRKKQRGPMDVWSHDRRDHLERLNRFYGIKEKTSNTSGVRTVKGNLRFPLD